MTVSSNIVEESSPQTPYFHQERENHLENIIFDEFSYPAATVSSSDDTDDFFYNIGCLLNDDYPPKYYENTSFQVTTSTAIPQLQVNYPDAVERPKKKFKSCNIQNYYVMYEGSPDISSHLHQSILRSENLSTRNTSRCLFCQVSKKACNSSPGAGKCERCINKSSQGEEIFCMFDMNLYRK